MELVLFKYQEMSGEEESPLITDFTTIDIDGEPWFVAHEVCKLLDIKNARDAISSLDDDEKLTSVIPTSGQNRTVNIISESGLYALIFRSKKPSAKQFRKWITGEVIPSIRKKGKYSIDRTTVSNFLLRYDANFDRIDNGYFSVIGELFVRLYTKFHSVGYDIPDKAFDGKEIRPDNSVGRLFSLYLKENYPDLVDQFKYYLHKFPNIKHTFRVRQYKNEVLPIFIDYVDNVWIPNHAKEYFEKRDIKALDYMNKLLSLINPQQSMALTKKKDDLDDSL